MTDDIRKTPEIQEPSAPPLYSAAAVASVPVATLVEGECVAYDGTMQEFCPPVAWENNINTIVSYDECNDCKYCGQPWAIHKDKWAFNTELFKRNFKMDDKILANKIISSVIKKYEGQLKILKNDIDQLNATKDTMFMISARKKIIEYKNLESLLEMEKRKKEQTIDMNTIEQTLVDYEQYQMDAIAFLTEYPFYASFLSQQHLMDEELFVRFLSELIDEYKTKARQCRQMNNQKGSIYTLVSGKIEMDKCTDNFNATLKKVEAVLCFYSKSKHYLREIMKSNGTLREVNDVSFVVTGVAVQLQLREEEETQIVREQTQFHNTVFDNYRRNNPSGNTRTFFQRLTSGFGFFDSAVSDAVQIENGESSSHHHRGNHHNNNSSHNHHPSSSHNHHSSSSHHDSSSSRHDSSSSSHHDSSSSSTDDYPFFY